MKYADLCFIDFWINGAQTFLAKGHTHFLETLGGHTTVKIKIFPQFYKHTEKRLQNYIIQM